MADYTLTLKNEEDYRLIKKLLKAFEGASIRPQVKSKSQLELSLEEARRGEIVGPFNSVKDFMDDLLN